MGQTFLNVAYGVVVTPEIDRAFREDPNDENSDLIDYGLPPECVDLETGDGFEYLAFSIATSGYAELEYEVEITKPMRLMGIQHECDRAITIAKNKWKRFAKWARDERNFELPYPELMLVRVERA